MSIVPKKVLIVEDQRDIRSLIQLTLETEGYNITEASNGEDGLNAARDFHPDLILLDVMMPGSLDGLRVCELIKSDPGMSHIKIILLTARSQLMDVDLGKKSGCDEYITKPFSPMELMDTTARLIGR